MSKNKAHIDSLLPFLRQLRKKINELITLLETEKR